MATFKLRKYRDLVYAICTLNKDRFKVSTGVKVEDRYWKNNELSKSCPNYKQCKDIIDTTLQEVINAYYRVKNSDNPLDVNHIKKEYFKEPEIKIESNDFFKDYENYLVGKTPILSHSSVRNNKYTICILKDFERDKKIQLNIETFDQKTFTKIINYFINDRRLLDNTIDKHVRMLKCFLKSTYPAKDISFMKYKEYDPEVIALNEHELQKVQNAQVTGHLKKTSDLFLFLCNTGMRYSDSQRFEKFWVKGQILDFTMQKTQGRAITPFNKAAKKIVEDYGGAPPKISNQKFNNYLKDLFRHLELKRPIVLKDRRGRKIIQSVVPLHDVISSHVARKTFITLLLRRGISMQDVMVMSGHSDVRELKKYYEISADHIRKNFSNLEF